MKNRLILALILIPVHFMTSQSLAEYQWKNRLLIIFSETENTREFVGQLREFEATGKELQERKLVIIHALPNKFRSLIPNETGWQDFGLYYEMKKSKEDFEIILIGLDGGVKLRQSEILGTDKLFGLIDSMPMRRAEMNKNDN
ncbi:DUF4174 domain-containing protein [Christiangramia sabulilitoris]|nr:DUF4174 domain-containing protein [Christiangramia sabulilitoris]